MDKDTQNSKQPNPDVQENTQTPQAPEDRLEVGAEPIEVPETPNVLPEDEEEEQQTHTKLRVQINNGVTKAPKAAKAKEKARDKANKERSAETLNAQLPPETKRAEGTGAAEAGKASADISQTAVNSSDRLSSQKPAAPESPAAVAETGTNILPGEAGPAETAEAAAPKGNKKKTIFLVAGLILGAIIVCIGVFYGMKLVQGDIPSAISNVTKADKADAEAALDDFFSESTRQTMAENYQSADATQLQNDLQSIYSTMVTPFMVVTDSEANAYGNALIALFNENLNGIAFQSMANAATDEKDTYGYTKTDYQGAADYMFGQVDQFYPLLKACTTEQEIQQWMISAGFTDTSTSGETTDSADTGETLPEESPAASATEEAQ